MQSIARFARRQREVLRHLRTLTASAELALSEDSKFLRFADPVSQETSHMHALEYIQPTKVTTLSNGLRVASETIPFAQTATVGVWIDAGSRYENDTNNGTAHFLEHMAFKGTQSRTTQQLEVEIENMGGHLNAYTSREQTVYLARVMKQDTEKAVHILSDILQNSNLDTNMINRERSVILREMQEIDGMPDEVVFDHLHATAFQWSPLGRTILGTADNIRSITREHLANYMATHYTAPRMVVSAAGAVEHEQLVALCEKLFSSLPDDPTTADELVQQDPAKFTGSDARIRDPDINPMHFAVAFKGAAWTDPDAVPLMVMQTMLGVWDKSSSVGGNMGSKLGQYVQANELCDSYMAFNTSYKDTGLWGVYAVADKDSMLDLSWCIMHEITKLCYEVNQADVLRAKNQLKASLLMSQSSTQAVAEDIGRQMLTYGRRMSKAEMFHRIDSVTADTVRAVADRFIYDQDIAIAALGDSQYMPDYNWFHRRTFWLRY